MNAERSFVGGEMRTHQLDARPLEQAHHIAGRKHMRHRLKIARFGVEMRHGLVVRHAKRQAMLQTWLKARFHCQLAFPAFSSPGKTYSLPSHGERKSKLRNSCVSRTGS